MLELCVIIPCKNASKWIKGCVQSVFAQLDGIKARVVVFDDGSTDESLEVLEQLSFEYDFDLLKSRSPESKGPFWIFNRVFEQYKADFYQTVDADDMLLEGASRHLMEYAAANAYGIVNGQGDFFYDTQDNPAPERWYPTHANHFLQIIRRNSIMLNSGKVITRKAVQALGPMCEDFICGMDVEYFFRADQMGIGLSSSPRKTISVRLHSSGGSLTSSTKTDHKSDYRQRANDMIFEKYPPRCNFAPEFEDFFKKELSLHGPNPSLYSQYTHYLEQYCQMLVYSASKPQDKLERIIRRPASRMLIELVLCRWENILLSGTGRVYLFGAGKHTNWLCGLVKDRKGPQIAGIIDDDHKKCGTMVDGFTVFALEQTKKDSTAGVVISSDTFVSRMRERLERDGIDPDRIINLYANIPQGPYLGLNTFWMWL